MMEKEVESILKNTNKCCANALNKWDKYLNDYENYVKEYIKDYKKSLKGNLVSLSKYPYMKAKSEALCEQLNDAQNKSLLTKKQLKRISKIQTKML
ncbi:hypothetical protein [Flavobacterium soyangense]|uniref:Uncharacterized protein n=1 Tax=Flavobacterium soyangense TaxID=2023265 RepID=A0A930UA55_9FLAO|nr:hypothetical protein [Flavobacterium soyangense]MBF2708337.1 hypothetical protein [Flavobacterium soyangense]